jgi:hypothetical protein
VDEQIAATIGSDVAQGHWFSRNGVFRQHEFGKTIRVAADGATF